MILDDKFAPIRKGLLEFILLKIIATEKVYAADILKQLSRTEFATQEGTLYPLLRRLETQGLLTSEWREEEKRNKRFYQLSAAGAVILEQLLAEWNGINDSLHKILEDKQEKKER